MKYASLDFMRTLLIPLLKNTKGDITSKDNYRPIAIGYVKGFRVSHFRHS